MFGLPPRADLRTSSLQAAEGPLADIQRSGPHPKEPRSMVPTTDNAGEAKYPAEPVQGRVQVLLNRTRSVFADGGPAGRPALSAGLIGGWTAFGRRPNAVG